MTNLESNVDRQMALQIAFKTMKERCQQLQDRLTVVEEENCLLRHQCEKYNSDSITTDVDEKFKLAKIEENKIENLKKQNSQLLRHIFMVSLENRQLWKRLSKLAQDNITLEVPSDLAYSFKELPELLKMKKNKTLSDVDQNEHSLEDMSQLIDSIMLENSDFDNLSNKIHRIHTNMEISSKNVGFPYPENVGTDSLEQLIHHDNKLIFIKETLLKEQNVLTHALQSIKKREQKKCKCEKNEDKLMFQTGTQINSDQTLKKRESGNKHPLNSESISDNNVCPLCGLVFQNPVSNDIFEEHVVNHFRADVLENLI